MSLPRLEFGAKCHRLGDWRSGSAAALHAVGRGFESLIAHHSFGPVNFRKEAFVSQGLPRSVRMRTFFFQRTFLPCIFGTIFYGSFDGYDDTLTLQFFPRFTADLSRHDLPCQRGGRG
jgi:hypothetical protein